MNRSIITAWFLMQKCFPEVSPIYEIRTSASFVPRTYFAGRKTTVFVYLYICVFVYVYFYLCICILTWIHYCNIWCRIRENIKHHSLIFSTQYSIYANLCKSESHHSRSQYIASKRLSFSPALTSQVCVRYDKSFLPEHFAQLHNLRYVATSEIYSQKYTHTHLRNAQK